MLVEPKGVMDILNEIEGYDVTNTSYTFSECDIVTDVKYPSGYPVILTLSFFEGTHKFDLRVNSRCCPCWFSVKNFTIEPTIETLVENIKGLAQIIADKAKECSDD